MDTNIDFTTNEGINRYLRSIFGGKRNMQGLYDIDLSKINNLPFNSNKEAVDEFMPEKKERKSNPGKTAKRIAFNKGNNELDELNNALDHIAHPSHKIKTAEFDEDEYDELYQDYIDYGMNPDEAEAKALRGATINNKIRESANPKEAIKSEDEKDVLGKDNHKEAIKGDEEVIANDIAKGIASSGALNYQANKEATEANKEAVSAAIGNSKEYREWATNERKAREDEAKKERAFQAKENAASRLNKTPNIPTPTLNVEHMPSRKGRSTKEILANG